MVKILVAESEIDPAIRYLSTLSFFGPFPSHILSLWILTKNIHLHSFSLWRKENWDRDSSVLSRYTKNMNRTVKYTCETEPNNVDSFEVECYFLSSSLLFLPLFLPSLIGIQERLLLHVTYKWLDQNGKKNIYGTRRIRGRRWRETREARLAKKTYFKRTSWKNFLSSLPTFLFSLFLLQSLFELWTKNVFQETTSPINSVFLLSSFRDIFSSNCFQRYFHFFL